MILSRFYQQQNLRTRLIFAFMLTVLIPLLGTSLYGNWITSQTLQSRAVEAAQADLHLRHLQMEETLRGVEENLLFLSQMNSLTALINGRSLENLARAQIDFADFVSTHPDIFQARYLDETGLEIVRIDATPQGQALLPPPDQLQNKANRYYFIQTMALPLGAVFISPIDLNREFGQIQQPHTPTLRYATAVVAADGTPAGIVIFNINAERLLQFVRGDTLSLTDDAGYFLAHANPNFEWGSPVDLNSGINLQTIYPGSWQEIRQTDQGVILPQPESSWQAAWEFITPFVANEDGRRVLAFETVQAGGNRWHLINDLPRAALFAPIETFRITAVFIVIWAMILAAGIAMLFSRQIAQPIQQLTAKARQFGQTHGAVLPRHPAPSAPTRYEIDELADAFQDMTFALERQMSQLTQLNLAGHHIAARLEQSEVFMAVSSAVHRIFPVEYLIISLQETILHQDGEITWAAYRHESLPNIVQKQALAEGNWTTIPLSEANLPSGYLCCAPLCVEGKIGLIELYGADSILDSQATGELLATLAVQVSIALENAELVARLALRRAELQALLVQILSAQEEERRRVAYDIHDGLIQMLVGVRLQLNNYLAERELEPEHRGQLQKGIDGLATAIVEARRVIEGLRPAALDDLGLVETIRYAAKELCREKGCQLHFVDDVADGRLPPAVETTAFRILQEAFTNARKYAQMSHLYVTLKQDAEMFYATVKDDGDGFDMGQVITTKEGGFGLRSMQERARLLGGDCVVESEIGVGTAVYITLPIRNEP
ncbi:hypothetical protein MNBD_CHLOROFLEXI01-3443 [hydrothermal vent metagenome]|uniref:histidine kinase n=1 Tax=hydrothermal vent metagenome TaxID=652676 RepID=A0A3B0VTD3_9ZZZZ